jgi:hypothetical protein
MKKGLAVRITPSQITSYLKEVDRNQSWFQVIKS